MVSPSMSSLTRVGAAASTAGSTYGHCKPHDDSIVPDEFPVGLRVLVVDDDAVCLKIVEKTLQRCRYTVTTCSQATVALKLLRERKNGFDVVLSDVHMPDMDGYKLLELVGLEMDLPVIMMSADTRTSAVMRGVRHGACDYLNKPIREAELKNIWQHVLRKRWVENKSHEHSGSFEENDWHKRGIEDAEYTSVNETSESVKLQKKRNPSKEEDDNEPENDDSSAAKKPRVVWSVELHQQFVSAVNQLGIDKAVPKRILELMNVPGLTRENVASHLQKFRLYLKRLSGVAQHAGMNPFCGVLDSSAKVPSMGRLDIHALAASGQIPPQTLAALQADLLGRSTVEQAPKLIQSDHAVSYTASLKPQTKTFPQEGTWASQSSSYPSINFQNNIYHQQSINVQPSCLVVPTQNVNYPNCMVTNSFDDSKGSMMARYANSASTSASSPAPMMPNDAVLWTGGVMKPSEYIPATYCVRGGEYDDGGLMSVGHVARGGSVIPTRFAVDEMELQSMGHVANGNKVKQEPDLDGSRGSIAMFQQFSANDLMSVFTE